MKFDVERPVEYNTIKVDDEVIKVAEPKLCDVPSAYAHVAKQRGRLPSLGEAILIRYALFKKDQQDGKGVARSNEYMRPSTTTLSFKNDGSFDIDAPYLSAFTELPTGNQTKELVKAGHTAHGKGKELIVPIKDTFICDLIAKAKAEGRVAPAQIANPLELATKKDNEKSAYGQDRTPIAMFGNAKLAELNASYLNKRNYNFGKVWNFTQQKLKGLLKGKEDHAVVRPVGLGGVIYVNISSVYAYGGFSVSSWAWPIVHVGAQKISTGKVGS